MTISKLFTSFCSLLPGKREQYRSSYPFTPSTRKWTALGLDYLLVQQYPEDVKFLCDTRLIYSILAQRNSSKGGPLKHRVEIRPNNGLWIGRDGFMASVASIRDELKWNPKEQELFSKKNPSERWNYFQNGLVPVDRYYRREDPDCPKKNEELYSVAHLSVDEVETLVEQAKAYDGFNWSDSPKETNEELSCVVQFVTHPRPKFKKPWLKNIDAQLAVHCGIRLIFSDGRVYSTGFGSTQNEARYYRSNIGTTFGSHDGVPVNQDQEDLRMHDGRVETNIPIGKERAEKILAQLNEYRKNGIRFNILKQNCMFLATVVLGMAGTNLKIKTSFGSTVYQAMPGTEDIPVIGGALAIIKDQAMGNATFIAEKLFPERRSVFRTMAYAVGTVFGKISTVIKNIFIIILGGHIGSPMKKEEPQSDNPLGYSSPEAEEDPPLPALEDFPQLLKGLFDDDASSIQHSSIFINWQLKQATTVVHEYSGQPSFQILPPQTPREKAYSERRKRVFTDLYKHSKLPSS